MDTSTLTERLYSKYLQVSLSGIVLAYDLLEFGHHVGQGWCLG
jgi:hypothetical protein